MSCIIGIALDRKCRSPRLIYCSKPKNWQTLILLYIINIYFCRY